MEDRLFHYGTPRHSGRYPWGSGQDPQRNRDFLQQIKDLKSQGLKETEIAAGMGMNTKQLRAKKSIAKDDLRRFDVYRAHKLLEKGYSQSEVGRRMGRNESYIRLLLNETINEKASMTNETADRLKACVEKKQLIDVGPGIEQQLGVSKNKLDTAIHLLKEQGYDTSDIYVEQLGTGKNTTIKVLHKAEIPYKEVFNNRDKICMVSDWKDGSLNEANGIKPIENISSKRIYINYAEDGGADKDGAIELRRGVPDLDLGKSRYAQVRIGVDGTHYLKGMALYSDKIPKGYDIVFNTNKTKDVAFKDVLKSQKEDPFNPFGANIQKDGQRGALNIVNEEGTWKDWSKTISSQVLSKQPVELAKRQLDLFYKTRADEYNDIMTVNNPTVRRKLLTAFADKLDADAVDLKAAGLPRTGAHVILPFPSMKENEVFAPNYNNGERVVLIRYPHGGRFEIPELTVNNKNPEAKATIPGAKDAIGIHPKVAELLSGADFDGDTVWVIPNPHGYIKTEAPLPGLKGFRPDDYKNAPGAPRMTEKQKGFAMGDVSNLITDMTIKGAFPHELERAVKHSMVVIDAPKHNLNYKKSYIDNGIAQLKARYQGAANAGAATIISRASSQYHVPDRKPGVKDPVTGRRLLIDPQTGKKLYTETGETKFKIKMRSVKTPVIDENGQVVYETITRNGKSVTRPKYISSKEPVLDENGKKIYTTVPKTIKSTKMYEHEDAFDLSSGTVMENTYAAHANKIKALANETRKAAYAITDIKYSPVANKLYAKEVESLNDKLALAKRNAPYERQAQLFANSSLKQKFIDNPNMSDEEKKKERGRCLAQARTRVGAKKDSIKFSEKEWEAIQAGAITKTKLMEIIDNANVELVKEFAMPRQKHEIPPTKLARAKAMLASGYNQAEIASALDISVSTLNNVL